jgi:hypothetical protein
MGGHRIEGMSLLADLRSPFTVAGMALDDAQLIVAVLAQPEVLLVFSAIVAATSQARPLDEMGHPLAGTSYITPFGLAKKTFLSREVIERAAGQLKRVGLVEVLPDEERRYESWRVNEAALLSASR